MCVPLVQIFHDDLQQETRRLHRNHIKDLETAVSQAVAARDQHWQEVLDAKLESSRESHIRQNNLAREEWRSQAEAWQVALALFEFLIPVDKKVCLCRFRKIRQVSTASTKVTWKRQRLSITRRSPVIPRCYKSTRRLRPCQSISKTFELLWRTWSLRSRSRLRSTQAGLSCGEPLMVTHCF